MNQPKLSLVDLTHHIVTFGIDVYPPIEITNERTRLNIFYEEARSTFPAIYDRLEAGGNEFSISGDFPRKADSSGPALRVPTFALNYRGPVFSFPLKLTNPVGDTGLEASFSESFQKVRRLFFLRFPTSQVMRIGMIRELVFETGNTPTHSILRRGDEFAGATLQGGLCLCHYQDAKCNIRVTMEPVSLIKATKLAIGPVVQEPTGFGLKVLFDVNSALPRPHGDADIQEVVERATSLWPEKLLDFLNDVSKE
jgi:hypothetical protein